MNLILDFEMIIHVRDIDSKFLASYVTWKCKKFRLVRMFHAGRQNLFTFADPQDLAEAEHNFTSFQSSGKTLDEWFDREIIVCKGRNKTAETFVTNIKKVTRTPLFIGCVKTKFHVVNIDEIVAKYPIEMTARQLCQLNGIHSDFEELEDLYSRYAISFRFLEVDKNHCFETPSLPGMRPGGFKTILVGKSKNRTYWMPPTFKVSQRLRCTKYPGKCFYWTLDRFNLNRHTESCVDESKVICDQKSYGKDDSMMKSLVEDKLLPASLENYRHTWLATFDIEALETKISKNLTERTCIETNQYIVSIGVSTNLPGRKDRFFVRKSSAPQDGFRLVRDFVNYLFLLQKELEASLPPEIPLAISKLKENFTPDNQWSDLKGKKNRQLRFLQKFTMLNVFGFNSSKYDLPTMIRELYKVMKQIKILPNILKKSNRYTLMTVGKLQFKDTLQFTAPTSLSKFLKQWSVKENKSVFPYEKFQRVESLRAAVKFPDYEEFWSSLSQQNVDRKDYDTAKELYEYRLSLPVGHPDRWETMLDFLKYYNLLDTRPLVEALERCFDNFHLHFNVNPLNSVSLPSLAFDAMFHLYDKNLPTSTSFCAKNDEIRKLFRGSVIGGLTTVAHRCIELDSEDAPINARIAPNGEKFSYLSFWDFNSMYLWS